MSASNEQIRPASWPAAARLLARWLDQHERIDALLDSLPANLNGAERARCQHLVLGVVRHYGRIESALAQLVAHPPRFSTRAILFIAGFELMEASDRPADEGRVAKIVHHAVEQTKALASPAEARLVNAVVRKLAPLLMSAPPPAATSDAATLAAFFSHPEWLVRTWLAQFGETGTRALLEWNQQPAPVYARWRGEGTPPDFLVPSRWPAFFEVKSGHWGQVEPLLKSGQIYLQDPGTRLAVELLAPLAGETVLDICAAPGGKSLLIADTMKTGKVVALDLPGQRIERLKENLSRAGAVDVALVQADLLENIVPVLGENQQPESYSAVLLDVPCSNTGVMRHRVDVKWRLQPGDLKKHPRQQLALLHAAARLVAPGGRLVYSTCSVDAEENEQVVTAFFNSRAGSSFKRDGSVVSLPWQTGHDGAAAFLLRRT